MTERIERQEWKIGSGDDEIRLNMWDFGGQEIMSGRRSKCAEKTAYEKPWLSEDWRHYYQLVKTSYSSR